METHTTTLPMVGRISQTLKSYCKIHTLKGVGKVTLKNYEELSTISTEVEGVTNTRPLTYLYSDDDITAITPIHLIIGRKLLENMNNSNIDDFDLTKDECSRH